MLNIAGFQSPLFEREQGHALSPRIRPAIEQFQPTRANGADGSGQSRFELFNAILQKAYERLADNIGQGAPNAARQLPEFTRPFEAADKISAQQAAGNILKFMEQRLKADLANGAGKDELLERVEQGLAGFIQGFNEARETIESLGLLAPELEAQIDETYQRVLQGIDKFRAKIDDRFSVPGEPANPVASVGQGQLRLAQSTSASFSLELVTQDGDRISIDIEKRDQVHAAASFSQNGDNSTSGIRYQQSSASRFNLTVEGEIDDEELAAINQLLENVDSIAVDFYAGNLDEAFASALDLNIDRDQLASLNLELQKTSVTKALASYSANAEQPPSSPLADLSQLVDDLDSALSGLTALPSPLSLFEQVVQGIGQLQDAEQGVEKGEQLGQLLGALISQFEVLPVEKPPLD
jgi:hypothetical protein